jgi:PAS domain S-box-containing protein
MWRRRRQYHLAMADDPRPGATPVGEVDLEELFAISSTLFCVANLDGRFVALNRAWESVLGLTRETLVSTPFLDFVHPDDVAATVAVMSRLRSGSAGGDDAAAPAMAADGVPRTGGDVADFVNRYRTGSGEYRNIEWRASRRGALIYATAMDVTDRVRAAEELRRSEALHRTLFEVTSQGIVYQDRDGRIIDANPAAERVLGLSVSQLAGRTSMDPRWRSILRDGSDFPGSEHPATVALDTGREVSGVVMGVFHPGAEVYRWLLVRSIPIFDDGCTVPRMVTTTFDDITESLEAQQEIERWNESLRISVAEQSTAIARLDALMAAVDQHAIVSTTDVQGVITYVNDNFCQVSGYRPDELLGGTHRVINSEHHPREFFTRMWQTILAGKTWQGEIRNRAKDGSVYWVLSTIAPFRDAAGEITQFVSIRTDITSQKQAELAAAAANRAKSQFLANMSHEIRTPLTAIIGLSHVADEPDLDPKVATSLSQIRESGEHLLAMLNDVLDFAKIEVEQVELHPQPMSLRHAIEQVVTMYGESARLKGLKLTSQVEQDLPDVYFGDAVRLRQVLLNLVSNAVKCTTVGSIAVTVSRDGEPDPQGGTPLRFAVTDTGTGIAAADLGRIFEPFVQADASPTRQVAGTGLGLAITSQLVRLMGGTLHADSELGVGSTFSCRIRLPVTESATEDTALVPETTLARGTPPAAMLGAAAARPRGNERVATEGRFTGHVLLVEDNEVNRAMAASMLQRLGLTVTEATNGREALSHFSNGGDPSPFDVVLMDVHMPVMDGWEATRRIRVCPGGGSIPIVALTASALRSDREACLAAGMNDHVSKPFRPADLAAMLGKWLPTSATLLDLTVALTSSSGDVELRTRLLTVFRQDTGEKVLALRAAVLDDDQPAMFGIGHSLKGAADLMGAVDLARAAREVEAAARDGRATSHQIDALVETANATILAVDAAITAED